MSTSSSLRVGLLCYFTADSANVADVARLAEESGVESLWAPEHTHIPVHFSSPTPTGKELPEIYRQLFDPFVVLSVAAAVTTRLRLGTGISLVANHDPITMAKRVATLDQVSAGRFMLGVGTGWIREEIEHHGVDFDTRWRRAVEHLAAMKEIWTQDEAAFAGNWVKFDPIYSWPKPVQRPHPPILFGTVEASALVLTHADGWLPLSVMHPCDLAERIDALKVAAQARGRDPESLEITVFSPERTTPERVAEFAAMGADRVVLWPRLDSMTMLEEFLDRFGELLEP